MATVYRSAVGVMPSPTVSSPTLSSAISVMYESGLSSRWTYSHSSANFVVLQAHPVQRQVDDHLRLGSCQQYLLDPPRDDLVLDAVGGDVDDARLAVAVSATDHIRQVFAQRWLATAEREPVRGLAQRLEHPVPFVEDEIVVGKQPDVASLAA